MNLTIKLSTIRSVKLVVNLVVLAFLVPIICISAMGSFFILIGIIFGIPLLGFFVLFNLLIIPPERKAKEAEKNTENSINGSLKINKTIDRKIKKLQFLFVFFCFLTLILGASSLLEMVLTRGFLFFFFSLPNMIFCGFLVIIAYYEYKTAKNFRLQQDNASTLMSYLENRIKIQKLFAISIVIITILFWSTSFIVGSTLFFLGPFPIYITYILFAFTILTPIQIIRYGASKYKLSKYQK